METGVVSNSAGYQRQKVELTEEQIEEREKQKKARKALADKRKWDLKQR